MGSFASLNNNVIEQMATAPRSFRSLISKHLINPFKSIDGNGMIAKDLG